MLVNPDVGGYTKSLHDRKILRKTQKITTLWKPNEYQNRNIG